jgi:DNA-binding transcriptional MocR family regulator
MPRTFKPRLSDQIAQRIVGQLQRGVPAPGSKLPSVRRYGSQLGVNVGTVSRAYWKLENEGFIECRPQSGFYVRTLKRPLFEQNHAKWRLSDLSQIQKLKPDLSLLSHFLASIMDSSNLFLSCGAPGAEVLDFSAIQKSLKAGLQKLGPKGFQYNLPSGYLPLKAQIARHYFNFGVDIAAEQVLLSFGCIESGNSVLSGLTKPGDIVAVESPIFPGWAMIYQKLGLKLVEIPSDPQHGMDLGKLRTALRKYPIKTCISMPNFSQAMGSLASDANKKRLVDLLADHGANLIENDMYGDLHYGPARPKPAKAFDKTGNVYLISSFSKTLAPGLRVGWIIPGKEADKVRTAQTSGNYTTNAFMEAGISDFIERGHYTKHLRKVRQFCASNLGLFTEAVARYFPEGSGFTKPQGGFMAWVNFPKKVDAVRLHHDALKEKILILPGGAFTQGSAYAHSVSFGFGHAPSDVMENALRLVGNLAKAQMAEKISPIA